MSRTKAERERIYGPPGRVEWVQEQPCIVCGRWPCVNAHTRTGGEGRKADYTTIVPACHEHHVEMDNGKKSFQAKYNLNLAELAAETEQRWLERS